MFMLLNNINVLIPILYSKVIVAHNFSVPGNFSTGLFAIGHFTAGIFYAWCFARVIIITAMKLRPLKVLF